MSLDGLVTRAIAGELAECAGGKINKIYQPAGHELVVHIRAQGRNRKLLLSANPTYPRVHYTEASSPNPTEAPMFCMLMRKHCEGAVIERIAQVGLERILHIDVRQRDEIGDISRKRIVVEMMGRHSNIILLDPSTGTVLDGIHHVTPAISSYRVVMPGSPYTPPPAQGKANPLETTEAEFTALLRAAASHGEVGGGKPVRQSLVDLFSGLGPLTAKEIVYRSGVAAMADAGREDGGRASDGRGYGGKADGAEANGAEANGGAADGEVANGGETSSVQSDRVQENGIGQANDGEQAGTDAVWRSFRQVMKAIAENRYEPVIVEEAASGKSFFSVIALTHLAGEARRFDSISTCLEAYYGDKAERDAVKQRAGDLLRFLQNERSKNAKKLEKLRETIQEAQAADEYRMLGELLTASLHLMQKGDKAVEVVNYYDEAMKSVRIELDPQLTPSENAQRYFKKYAKLRNSLTVVEAQVGATEAELVYIDTLLAQLDQASLVDIEGIRDELVEQGYLRERGAGKRGGKKKKTDKPLLTCYTSKEGVPIYVGKNNIQNEYLTNRLAQPNDTWLHTKDIPGSHVVIRADKFGESTLSEAALLAAYYSQAKSSSQVPVDYTLIRHVRKPNGAKPGFVIYERQKTLYMTPDEQAVKAMPVTVK